MVSAPTLTLSMYWLEQQKKWMLVVSGGRIRLSRYVDTTAELDRVAVRLLCDAIDREMTSWLSV